LAIVIAEKLTEIANNANVESETSQHSDDDIKQLEEYLKRSGFSSQSSDGDENAEVKVRSYVRKFLALRMNKDPFVRNIDMGDSQRKTVSFAVHQRKKHLDAKVKHRANNSFVTFIMFLTLVCLFQSNNLNVIINEQNQDQAIEDRSTELEDKKSTHVSIKFDY